MTPADKAEALENEDIKEEVADKPAGVDGLFDALATADGGDGSLRVRVQSVELLEKRDLGLGSLKL